MYSTILTVHNVVRWAVLLAGLYAITRSVLGLMSKREFNKQDNISHAAFLGMCHLQLLLGLILYFVSPVVTQAFAGGMGNAMKDPATRFIAVEHAAMMIIGIVLIQVGRSLSKKQTDGLAKHKKALVFFIIGMVLILSRIPWNRALWPS